jgi:hypothetical protein
LSCPFWSNNDGLTSDHASCVLDFLFAKLQGINNVPSQVDSQAGIYVYIVICDNS